MVLERSAVAWKLCIQVLVEEEEKSMLHLICAGPSSNYAPAAGDAEVPDFEPDLKRQRQ